MRRRQLSTLNILAGKKLSDTDSPLLTKSLNSDDEHSLHPKKKNTKVSKRRICPNNQKKNLFFQVSTDCADNNNNDYVKNDNDEDDNFSKSVSDEDDD